MTEPFNNERRAALLHGDFSATLERVQPYTMVNRESLTALAQQVSAVLVYDIPGAFVECGAWRGGASFLMADLLRQAGATERRVWLCDSFEGIPPPQALDGAAAQAWAADQSGAYSFDNLRVGLEEVQQSAAALGLRQYTEFVKGYFEQTLPAVRARIGPIALLRIDCDWYASVRCCLEQLFEQVVEGGFVIFDDYHTYDGCALAVHEFMGARKLPYRLEHVAGKLGVFDYYHAAYFRKGGAPWTQLYPCSRARQELAALLPEGATFILLDQAELGAEIAPHCRALPFPEQDGYYNGPPADDAAALAELARQRAAGARWLVVAWPAFWWLDYYAELNEWLSTQARRVWESERLIVFALGEDTVPRA
ncbi:MAG: class I SAM-dependent methyltransferase [Acidobacteria bacterium]|nr:class I SAM-dependent methyltransferase [Acidobacteriota bacterium]MBI3426211.1 class I SAM-dependent methyltransferase [Acidobacteriota bacterium]